MTEQIADGFDRFVAHRSGRLWRAAWLLTGDRHKAEDLVQTALSKTYGRYESMADDEAYEAYLRVTLYRTYVSWWRRRWNSELPTAEPPDELADDISSSISLDVTRALAELPKMQRAVLVLRFFEDRSVADVAEALGITEGTVKTHTSRGCARLRGSLHLVEEAS
ncbi:SigE family RNA polymerase sigma factor [Tessaracoccus caeni]|uniref:SigE family RNA polymerase sigma factor n=1 Tax=Tessaracoccus caeni TaxID=3031239 RepID=UPI0023DBFB67|nr:SigE family RNA polymerase sigma factor [Tessaracoccus caeni]MDF1487535.1 SigE family RNA polymerase sigma factor [Tessaracoccus caeni]